MKILKITCREQGSMVDYFRKQGNMLFPGKPSLLIKWEGAHVCRRRKRIDLAKWEKLHVCQLYTWITFDEKRNIWLINGSAERFHFCCTIKQSSTSVHYICLYFPHSFLIHCNLDASSGNEPSSMRKMRGFTLSYICAVSSGHLLSTDTFYSVKRFC